MKHTSTHHYLFSPSSEISGFLTQESHLVFHNESLKGAEKQKKKEQLTVGQEAVKTHEQAEKHKKQVEKSPLRKFIDTNPDSEVAAADESRNEGIANVVKGEDHKKVSALLMGNIPPEAGEKIAGSLMNDYN